MRYRSWLPALPTRAYLPIKVGMEHRFKDVSLKWWYFLPLVLPSNWSIWWKDDSRTFIAFIGDMTQYMRSGGISRLGRRKAGWIRRRAENSFSGDPAFLGFFFFFLWEIGMFAEWDRSLIGLLVGICPMFLFVFYSKEIEIWFDVRELRVCLVFWGLYFYTAVWCVRWGRNEKGRNELVRSWDDRGLFHWIFDFWFI